MKTKTRPAILPTSKTDPTGVERLERGAIREFQRRLRRVAGAYIAALNRIPAEPAVNRRYVFRLESTLLAVVFAQADVATDAELLEGGERNLWFFESFVGIADRRGTAQAFANLSQQSDVYRAGRVDLASLLQSPPYQARIALVRARQFEEMKGLTAQVKADMARVLSDGIGRGLNPLEVARNLNEQVGLEMSRARRIARTEIPMALRRARWDERDAAADAYGLDSKLMHISALSETTRATHSERHAHLFTSDEVRDWYSQDGNAINCKCSQVEVLVDEEGKPLVPQIVERAKQNKAAVEARSQK